MNEEELRIYNIYERDYTEKVKVEIRNKSLTVKESPKSKTNTISYYIERIKGFVMPQVKLKFYFYQPKVFSYLENDPFSENPLEISQNDDKKNNDNFLDNHSGNPRMYTEFFELLVESSITVNQLRLLLFEQIDEKTIGKPVSPLHIRIREIYANFPSNILPNNDTLTLSGFFDNIVFNGKSFAFQFLEQPEPLVDSSSFVVPVFQRWHPSSYTFGPRFELVLDKNLSIDQLKEILSKKSGIQKISLSKSSSKKKLFLHFFYIFKNNRNRNFPL